MKHKIFYIFSNIILTGVGILKSFIFLKYLNDLNLGLVAIIQTIILLVSFLQLGLINGGYRIISVGDQVRNFEVNSLIHSFLCIVFFSLIIITWIGNVLIFKFNYTLIFIALIIGFVQLFSTWVTNIFLGMSKLKEVNLLIIVSTLISLILLPTVIFWGVYAAFFLLFIQPFSLVITSYIKYNFVRPKKFLLNKVIFFWILKFGFIPFLAGILGYLNLQIERWSIVYWLGPDQLGKYYLAITFTNIFLLIPNSINNLFFPNSMKFFSLGRHDLFVKVLKKFITIIVFYSIIAVILTLSLGEKVVGYLFPQHLESLKFVYLIIPSVVSMTFVLPINIFLNASVRLKPMLIAYLTGMFIDAISILFFVYRNDFNLTKITLTQNIVNIYIFLFLLVSYYFIKNSIYKKEEILNI